MRLSTRASVLVALALSLPAVANAATREVGTGKQYKTIKKAIDAASNGDLVLVYAGTYVETVDFLGKSLTLQSVSGAAATTIQGNSSNAITVSNVTAVGGAVIDGFTIKNTDNRGIYSSSSTLVVRNSVINDTGAIWLFGGAIQQIGGLLTVEDTTFTNNTGCAGGDVYLQNGGVLNLVRTTHTDSYGNYSGGVESVTSTLNMTDVSFVRPYADYEGGAVRMLGGTGNFTDVEVHDADGTVAHGVAMALKDGANVTWNGGTVEGSVGEWCYYGAVWVHNGSTLNASGLTFSYNTGGIGAALAITESSDATLTGGAMDHNEAMNDGGALVVWYDSSLVATGVAFTNNHTDWDGGVAHVNDDSTLVAEDSAFDDNSADGDGGAIRANYASAVSLTGGSMSDNAGEYGGGVKGDGVAGGVTLDGVTVSNNAATSGSGGAVWLAGSTDLTVKGGSFEANTSQYEGGAIYAEGGWIVGDRSDVAIQGASFTSNSATEGGGGAIYAGIRAWLDVADSTFESNTADDNGGAVWKDLDGDLDMNGSTLTGNHTDADGGAVYVYASLYGGTTADVRMSDNVVHGNDAGDDGGGLAILCSVNGTFESNRLTHNNAADKGGGAYVYYLGAQTLTGNFVCGNAAANGGGAYNTNYWPVTDVWDGNWFQENTATANGGGVYHYGAYNVDMVGTNMLGNDAVLGGGAYLSSAYLTMNGGYVAWNGSGNGVHASNTLASNNSTFTNAHWFANLPADVGGYLTAAQIAGNGNDHVPPNGVTLDGDCTNDDPWGGPCPGADPVDSDGDGMPDACDVCPAGSDIVDSDGDGVADGCDACLIGDDNVDADGDGVADACDVCPFDVLNDSDGDGACDSDDDCPTNPAFIAVDACGCGDLIDSDGDGVSDCNDLCPGGDDTMDWDGDGTPDACDVCQGGVDTDDGDGDGVPDLCDDAGGNPCYDELVEEPIPCLGVGDYDGDGLSDVSEINLYLTDSFNPDTDGDGLTDGEEVMVYGTNPRDADTDGDSWLDAEELVNGTDPLVSDAPKVLEVFNPTPGTAGVVNDFTVAGGTPGEMVTFYMSRSHGTSGVASCPDVVLDMASPNVIGTALVDAAGNATFHRFVGAGAAGRKYRVQAVENETCRVSGFVEETF